LEICWVMGWWGLGLHVLVFLARNGLYDFCGHDD
jgi:hypothetical protein